MQHRQKLKQILSYRYVCLLHKGSELRTQSHSSSPSDKQHRSYHLHPLPQSCRYLLHKAQARWTPLDKNILVGKSPDSLNSRPRFVQYKIQLEQASQSRTQLNKMNLQGKSHSRLGTALL